MPRRPRFRTAALRELLDGLRFAPPETLHRQMLAAEALAMRLDPMGLYGRAAIVHAVTGFRPEGRDEDGDDGGLVGQAVLGDLSNFVERVSERLELRHDDRPGGALALEASARFLGVTVRTLLRYRSLGLPVHWIGFEPGRRRVGCFVEAMERFRAARLAEQGPRRRRPALTEAQRQAVLGAAAEIADAGSMPLAEAATIVGARASIEPRRVRAVLAGSGLGFRARRRSSRDERRLAYRAWRRGADPRAIAARIGRDRAATWRAVNAGRRAALRSLVLPPVDPLPTFEHAAAAEVLLAPDAVRRGLCARALPAEALALLREAPPVALPGRAGEVDACRRLVAMRFLLWRAARAVARLGSSPTSHELDRIETDLRNAAALRRTLVLHALPAVLGRIEAMIGASLLQAPGELLGAALRRAVTVTVGSLDSADGLDAAEGRLRTARHAALLMDRDLALRPIEAIGRRASPGAGAAARTVPIADPEAIMAPWSALLPFAQPPARLAECGARARALLERRHGWSGALAPTVTELAAEERVAPSILQHRLQEAWTRRGP